MELKLGGRPGTCVTTVFGIDRADTSNLFDDVQLTKPVSVPAADNAAAEEKYFEYIAAALQADKDKDQTNTQIVVHLPQISDGVEERTAPGAANSNKSKESTRYKDKLAHPSSHELKKQVAHGIPTHAMAVCEVFNFSNGVVDQLRSQIASLPIAGKYQRGKSRRKVNRIHSSGDSAPIADMNITSNTAPALGVVQPQCHSLERLTIEKGSSKRKLEVISRIRQTYSGILGDSNTHSSISQKNVPIINSVETDEALTELKQDDQEENPQNIESGKAEPKAPLSDKSESSQLTLPSLDPHRNSISSIGSTNLPPTVCNHYYEFTAVDSQLALPVIANHPQIERRGDEALNIYRVAKARARAKLPNSHPEKIPRKASESQFQMSFLTARKIEDVSSEPHSLERLTRQKIKKSAEGKNKLPTLSKTVLEDKKQNGKTKVKQRKMFMEEDYNQFCHRKVKKSATLTRERCKQQLHLNNNLPTKQYDQNQAMRYIKVRIGDLVAASPMNELIPINEGREDNFHTESHEIY